VPAPTQPLRYDLLLQKALRGVLRDALSEIAAKGLPGNHHLYITFRTQAPDVAVPPNLVQRYPDEMTVVLQHEFWGLEVDETGFQVTLNFNNRGERLIVPFAAVVAFADPSVNFGLQFQPSATQAAGESKPERDGKGMAEHGARQEAAAGDSETSAAEAEAKPGDPKVVTLDRFRRK
jgi:hypothetical protein